MRPLTDDEREVLAHLVLDPDEWWTHCQTAPNILDSEQALKNKVERHRASYEQAKLLLLENYKTRAELETQ